ncbi:MAG TPA: NAD(P)H-hydrate dehydratase [Acidimicrobiales bacterium]|nr:NAD(P)H-hydrate dehydratase [Acidimicrobiales bacterium]
MQPVLTRDEMQAADAAALSQVSHETLVERAGTAVAQAALRILSGAYGKRVVVVVGRGSNGADGRVAAAILARRGARVSVIEAAEAPSVLSPCDLVLDGAYGTGFHGTYDAPEVAPGVPVLAIDIPSGINADTGDAGGHAVRARHTVTFAAYKPGLLQGAGPERSGQVEVVDIGIDTGSARAALMEDADIAALLPARPRQSHKWVTALGVAAGSVGMEGSAVLCTRGALGAGAGMIRLGSPGDPAGPWPTEAVRMSLPETGWGSAFLEATVKCRALVIGPGLGTDEATQAEIRAVITGASVPMVVDADGLSALGDLGAAQKILAQRSAPTVLTPHDGEYARLAGHPPGDDRLAAARHLAQELGAVVLLKGPLTAVARPTDGSSTSPDVLLAAAGVPALATAGTGDVLSGVIGAFLARGMDAPTAAALAAHVHGRAAASGALEGLVAGDLPALVAAVLSRARADG